MQVDMALEMAAVSQVPCIGVSKLASIEALRVAFCLLRVAVSVGLLDDLPCSVLICSCIALVEPAFECF